MGAETSILIATLGSKPQVVTTAVDLLLARGQRVREVRVLYLGKPNGPTAPALESLQAEFHSHPPYQSLSLQLIPIVDSTGPLTDILTESDAHATFRALYRAVLDAKRSGASVHLSIVGGRKVLAVYGMAAAQLLFDDDDCLWYVLVGGRFFAEERLHPQPGDEAQLVRAPVLRWGTLSPMLTDLREIDDPFEAVERQRARRIQETLEEARAFVLGALTGAERRVVELFVREGLGYKEIAERLDNSPRTVEHHLREAYRKAADHWALPAVAGPQLVALLNLYYRLT